MSLKTFLIGVVTGVGFVATVVGLFLSLNPMTPAWGMVIGGGVLFVAGLLSKKYLEFTGGWNE